MVSIARGLIYIQAWLVLIFGALEIVFAASHIYLLSLLLIASVGFMEIAFAEQAVTMIQTITPDHLRGRVLSVYILFFDGSLPPGYLLMGWLSGLYGPAIAMLTGAVLCLIITGAGWLWHKTVENDMPAVR